MALVVGEGYGIVLMSPEFLIGQFLYQVFFRIQQHQISFAAYKSYLISFGRKRKTADFFRSFIDERFRSGHVCSCLEYVVIPFVCPSIVQRFAVFSPDHFRHALLGRRFYLLDEIAFVVADKQHAPVRKSQLFAISRYGCV